MNSLTPYEKVFIVVSLVLLISQATWIFYDASKRGENKWLWGFFGLINLPSSLIIYLIVTRKYTKQMICPHCLYSIKKESLYCSYCGHEITERDREIGHKNKRISDYDS